MVFKLVKFVVRLGVVIAIVVYIFPDMPKVVAHSLGSAIGEMIGSFSASYFDKVKEGVTPEWWKSLASYFNQK